MLVVSTDGRGVLAEHHPFEGNRDTYSGRYTASGAHRGRGAVAADIRQQCPAGRPARRGVAAAPRTTGALRGNGAYGAAKAALMAWNHTLAQQLGPHGATANVVLPGFVSGTAFFGAPADEKELRWGVEREYLGSPAHED